MHHLTYCSKRIIWCMSRWHVFSLEVLLTSVLEDPGVSIMPHAQHELIAETPIGVNGPSITEGVQECQSDTDSKRQWLLFVLPYSYAWLTICSDLMLTDLSLPGESLWPLWLTSLKVLFMMVCPQYWVCGLTHHGLPTVLGLWSGHTHHGLPTVLGLWSGHTHHGLPTVLGLCSGHTHHGLPTILVLWSHTPWFAHSIGSVVSHSMVCSQYWVCGLVTHTMVCPQYWVCGLTHHGLPTVLGLWSHTPWFAHNIGSVVLHTMVCPQYWVCGLVTHTMVCPQYWVCGHTPWFAHSIGSVVSHTSFPLAALLSPIIHT